MDNLVPDIATTGPRPAQLWPRYTLLLGAASLVVAGDQLTKVIVQSKLEDGRVVELLGGAVRLDYTRNTGAAFGLYQAGDVFFALIAALVSAGIILYFRRVASGPLPLRLGLGLVLGGALGNLIDRLRFGYVIDFVDLRWWPVFNVADSCIVIGVCLLIMASLHSPSPSQGEAVRE